jgi:hypothetical protein
MGRKQTEETKQKIRKKMIGLPVCMQCNKKKFNKSIHYLRAA